jgi:BRCT domain type II-containing protein
LIEAAGGKVNDMPSSKTSYIVIGQDAGAKKIQKAEKFNIPKLTEQDLIDLLGVSI